jgi:hypothetical protein
VQQAQCIGAIVVSGPDPARQDKPLHPHSTSPKAGPSERCPGPSGQWMFSRNH